MRLRLGERVLLFTVVPGVVFGTISALTLTFGRKSRHRTALELGVCINVVAVGGLCGTIVGAFRLAAYLDERLRCVSDSAQNIAGGQLNVERISGDDEFAALDATLHGLALAANERQAALQATLDQANEVSRLQSQFVATLSHEIRTPMNGVIGMSELLLQTPLNSEQHDFADAIAGSGSALLNIVNDLLDYSKIEAGHMQLDRTDFQLVEAVESVTTLLASQAQAKGIVLMSFIDPAVPRTVNGDCARLRQVLLNVIGNALKFTERGSVIVEVVSAASDAPGGSSLRFAIKDTGIGIARSVGDALFEPFAQADGSTTRRFGGTGLGLAISRSLVEMMGGQICYTSEIGVGTTFCWTLPLPAGNVTESAATSDATLRGMRALVVDDDAATREILSRYLQAWGMRSETVADPHAVMGMLLAAAASDPYAISLIDFRMPGLDGVQLGREIAAQPETASTALILVTAYDDVERGKSAHEAGFSDYLVKPVRQHQLYGSIVHAISARNGASMATLAPALPIMACQRSERVLLVEDNAVNQRVALRQLEKLGFAAITVDNGRAAVDALETSRFDLVLMDCHMPVMDGFEATARIRARELQTAEHVAVVAMTASAQARDREECLAAGMDDYLSKPVTLAELQRVIERWLQKPAVELAAAAATPSH